MATSNGFSNPDLTPANGVQGSSYIYQYGTTPNTRVAMSQKIRLLTPAYGGGQNLFQIGLVADFSASQSKGNEPVRGIGFGDHIAEIVPTVTDPVELSITRSLMYLSNIWQATGYASGIDGAVRSLKHHRWPFDLEHQLVFSTLVDMDLYPDNPNASTGSNGSNFHGGHKALQYPKLQGHYGENPAHSVLITMYEACWWTSWDLTNQTADGGVLQESGSAAVTDVHDYASVYGEFLASGNDPTLGQYGSIRFGNANDQVASTSIGGE